MIDATKKYKLRDNTDEVLNVAVFPDVTTEENIIVEMRNEAGKTWLREYYSDGRYLPDRDDPWDLIEDPTANTDQNVWVITKQLNSKESEFFVNFFIWMLAVLSAIPCAALIIFAYEELSKLWR